ncbi:hypothetical protein [Hwanghaeella sp.]|uniref:hypothetical protein n=1 Tax=Hwanghaeella sp. TaxID=2605943 RepID=UPI003CCBC613
MVEQEQGANLDGPEIVRQEHNDAGVVSGTSAAAAKERERIRTEVHALRFQACVSARYCQALEKHYRRLSNWAGIITAIGGAAVIADALVKLDKWAGFDASLVAGVVVAVAGILPVFTGWAQKASDNKLYMQIYSDAAARLIPAERTYSQEKLDEVSVELNAKKGLHEATNNVLYLICFNDECGSRGRDDEKYVVAFWQRLFSPWFDLSTGKPRKVG